MTNRNPLQTIVTRLGRPAEIAQHVQALANEDHDLAVWTLRRLLAALEQPSPAKSWRESKRTTHYDRVAAALVEADNAPMTKEELVKAAGLTDSALHTVLYSTATDKIERMANPNGGRAKVVRLVESEYQRLAGQIGGSGE